MPRADFEASEEPNVTGSAGRLLYEAQEWVGCTGAQWRALADEASRTLAKQRPIPARA